ncbi:unnamed protein product [Amoebophrya sp. A120]|nr:unnamed protein product [Amoebophrya sp. A120]|eukprot:GSA120T00003710001.1
MLNSFFTVGFTLLARVAVAAPTDFVLVTVPGERAVKYIVPGEPAAKELISEGLQQPHGLSFDTKTNTLYVTDVAAQKVFRYSLSASSKTELTAGSATETARNIEAYWSAVDPRSQRLFLTEKDSNFICAVDLQASDGSCKVTYQGETTANPIGLPELKYPAGIDVDGRSLFYGNGQQALSTGSIFRGLLTPPSEAPVLTKLPDAAITDVVQGVCVTPSNVFYTDGGANLFALKKWGGTPMAVSAGLSAGLGCAWNGDGAVYVADQQAGVYRIPSNMEKLQPLLHLEKVSSTVGAAGVAVFSTDVS